LRNDKENCKLRFNSILAEGEYTVDDLIAALEFDVLQKKENSVKTSSNKLTFMQNSYAYLNQRTFESFIELVKAGTQIEETNKTIGGTDI
jgi:ABC-type glutathione transport system ATPase component